MSQCTAERPIPGGVEYCRLESLHGGAHAFSDEQRHDIKNAERRGAERMRAKAAELVFTNLGQSGITRSYADKMELVAAIKALPLEEP